MNINFDEFGFKEVKKDDHFHFVCSCCGDCCRNVKDSVMVESLDLYHLARFLGMEMSEVCSEYMDTVYLSWGYPVFVLRTKQHKDTCIFLKSSKCIVHDAKPRACRTYPLGVEPDDEVPNKWLSFMVSKSQDHFSGQRYLVEDWLDKNFTLEDKEFVEVDYNDMGELVELMMKIDKQHEEQVINLILFYKYIAYNMDKDFQSQYRRNMEHLKKQLKYLGRHINA